MNEQNAAVATKLLRMATYLMCTRDLPPACVTSDKRIDLFGLSLTPAEVIRKFGPMEKAFDYNLFILRKKMDGFDVEFNFDRNEVCQKVEKWRVTIPAKPETIIPAQEAREEIEYEWKCPPSLLRGDEEATL